MTKLLNKATGFNALNGGATALMTKDDGGGNTQEAPTKSNAELAEEVKKMLSDAVDNVKGIAQDALGKATAGEELSKSTKQTADEALTKLAEFDETLKAIQLKMQRPGGLDEDSGFKSAGELFTTSDAFTKFDGQELAGSQTIRVDVKAISSLTTDADGSMGAHVRPDRVISPMATMPQRRLFIRELIAPGQTTSNLIEYVQETGFSNNADMVAEGAQKPESFIKAALVDAKVRKVAHLMHATMEILQDVPLLRSMIDQRLRYGLEYKLEGQILNGDGTGNNLNGIFTQATAYAVPTGAVVTGETRIDRLRLAFLQAALAEYPVDGAVLNPIDWANIELTKDTDGRYIIGNPQGTIAPTLWGRRVVATQNMAVNNFLTGSFSQGAQLFDRMLAAVMASSENKDNFEKNMVTILAELRVALAVYRPEAFIKGNFTFA